MPFGRERPASRRSYLVELRRFELLTSCVQSTQDVARLLHRTPTSTLAEISGLSKSYISQVKSGKRPVSQKLLNALEQHFTSKRPQLPHLELFLQSRQAMGVSPKTLDFYVDRLGQFGRHVNYLKATRKDIERYLNSIPANENGLATRHASFRTIKTFYRWLADVHSIPNPMGNMPAPILSKVILPALTREQVLTLVGKAQGARDKAIVALFAESGLRLSELTNVRAEDIDWTRRTIKVMGKGRKEAYAPFGELSKQRLKAWFEQRPSNHGNIWDLNRWGIATMLRRLEEETGLPCNPHTFRRTFACLLRKAGVDVLTIKDLGRWESLEMVQRYTRSVTFHDSLKLYKPPLS